jgi:hypothetical protein
MTETEKEDLAQRAIAAMPPYFVAFFLDLENRSLIRSWGGPDMIEVIERTNKSRDEKHPGNESGLFIIDVIHPIEEIAPTFHLYLDAHGVPRDEWNQVTKVLIDLCREVAHTVVINNINKAAHALSRQKTSPTPDEWSKDQK